MMEVLFRDFETNENINAWRTDWEFKVGQNFRGFWGCDNTVMKVELSMYLGHHWEGSDENRHEVERLVVEQIVYVKRVPIEI